MNAAIGLGSVAGHADLVVGRERPLHLRPDILVVFDDQQRRLASSRRVDRETGVKRGALADLALDVHAAAMRQHDGARLKQADAQPLLLGALERPEQGSLTNAGLMPQPLSITDSTTRLPRCSVRTSIRPPTPNASRAFSTRLVTTL